MDPVFLSTVNMDVSYPKGSKEINTFKAPVVRDLTLGESDRIEQHSHMALPLNHWLRLVVTGPPYLPLQNYNTDETKDRRV